MTGNANPPSSAPSNSPERELKPCPFCGQRYITCFNGTGVAGQTSWVLECSSCAVSFHADNNEQQDDVFGWWNTRSTPDASRIQELEGAPTGIEAARLVADYMRLRFTPEALDGDGDAANIIDILHEAGVAFSGAPSPQLGVQSRDEGPAAPAGIVKEALEECLQSLIFDIRVRDPQFDPKSCPADSTIGKALAALSTLSSAMRWTDCPECKGDCVVFPHGEGCPRCDGVGRLAVTSTTSQCEGK